MNDYKTGDSYIRNNVRMNETNEKWLKLNEMCLIVVVRGSEYVQYICLMNPILMLY